MKYSMRQTRDGGVELVDGSPPKPLDGSLLSAIQTISWGTGLLWYVRTLAWVWVGKGLFNWAMILGAFPASATSPPWRCRSRRPS